jgi:DNA polymerase-1
MSAETLYLLDAHSLIYQVFHAIGPMTSPAGLPTNAVFGFTRDLFFLREKKPNSIICVFDAPGGTFRDEIYQDYKAHRAAMPDDLQLQIPMIHKLLAAMNVPLLAIPNVEADDVIATLARLGETRGMDVFICSSDKDCRQLISDRVKVFNLRKREIYDAASLMKDWGVTPAQVIDYQTLVGDSVDNVPGVEGVGPKTATQYLQTYGSIDRLLARLDELKGKKRENLEKGREKLAMSRSLVTLKTDVPLNVDWEAWSLKPWNAPALLDAFREWGFQRFQEEVKNALPTSTLREPAATATPRPAQGDLFSDLSDEPAATAEKTDWKHTYHLVNDAVGFASFLKNLKNQKRFAIDLETTSLTAHSAAIVGFAICWQAEEAWYIAIRGPECETSLDPDATLAALKPILEDPAIEKINQNIKYDCEVLKALGVELRGIAGDSMIADYLLNAGERGHGMDALSEKYLKHTPIPIADLIGKGKSALGMHQVSCAKVAEYAGEDADIAFRLCALLEPILEREGMKRPTPLSPGARGVGGEGASAASQRTPSPGASHFDNGGATRSPSPPAPLPPGERGALLALYDDIEIPLIPVLADMQHLGIRLDVPLLQTMSVSMGADLERLEGEIHALAGRPFNIASVKVLREILFTELGFKPTKRTAITKAASTDQETLEDLARQGHELPKKLLEHRKIAKLKSTYVDALPALVHPKTGRVHCSFNQTIAATGRLSSSDPNLQNIPIRSELGGQIRAAFIPREGWKLIAADYSQIELRFLAHFSDDEALRKAFADNVDIHALVASQVFNVDIANITDEQRRIAKTVNFGVIYGMSAFGLADRLDLEKDVAAEFIDAYFRRYPRVLAYQDGLLNQCLERGYVSTILGRRRAISGIRANSTYKNRNQPEREAINMQIQGSAADLIKAAMLKVHSRLAIENRQAKLLLQIHDELVLEAPPEEADAVIALVKHEMATALGDLVSVPLAVDVGVGPNWLEC